jgi:hypothetical protein
MTTDVKFFDGKMAGAPQISGTKGSLLAVIDACLVTGFGLKSVTSITVASGVATVVLSSGNFVVNQVLLVEGATPAGLNGEKRVLALTAASTFTFDATGVADGVATGTITAKVAPLGWLKAFAGTNSGAYKIDPALYPDTTGCLVRLEDTGNYATKICGYESMTSVDVGAAPFPTVAQRTTGLWVFRSESTVTTSYRHWFVVGDGRFVYVGVHSYYDNLTSYGNCWFGFGEFKSKKTTDPFRFLVTGNGTSDTTSDSQATYACTATSASYLYCARSYTGLGGSVGVNTSTWPSPYGASGGAGPIPYPNGPDYGLYLCDAQIIENTHYRGDWPGMKFIPQNLSNKICADTKTAYFDTEVVGYENKLVGFYPCAHSSAQWGVVAFDLTGPWAH